MNRLVIIDGHALLHRSFHALPLLTTTSGKPVNAVYGFISILLRVIEELKPTHLVVVFDTPKPTFRNKLFKDYQATRPEADEKLIPQFGLAHKVVDEMRITHFETDGYEADDIIGTIISKLKTQNSKLKSGKVESIIVTGDKDLMQLVDEQVKVYMPVKGLSVSKLYDDKGVEEKLGVRPELVVDYKALVGDSSDNYGGVGGIGPKTAQQLLKSYGSFENVYRNMETIKNKSVKEKLARGKKEGELSKQLATIVKNAPMEFNLEKCQLKPFDTPEVRWLFEELEFKSLIPRLSGNKKKDNMQQLLSNTKSKKKSTDENQISLF